MLKAPVKRRDRPPLDPLACLLAAHLVVRLGPASVDIVGEETVRAWLQQGAASPTANSDPSRSTGFPFRFVAPGRVSVINCSLLLSWTLKDCLIGPLKQYGELSQAFKSDCAKTLSRMVVAS